jgi:predicted O-methyltransferase YrrM
MKHIRPWQFFSMYDGQDRDVVLPIPRRRGLGGLTAIETLILITAARMVEAKRIFEFGTFLGATTLSLARNTGAEIVTLDLSPEEAQGLAQNPSEAEITSVHLANPLDFEGRGERITVLHGNSLTYDFAPLYRSFDFVFIDAGHELPNLISDTENALKLATSKSCIAWHDYGNPEYPELKQYLDAMPDLLHVEDSWICLRFL